MIKRYIETFVIPLLVPVLVGIGSAAITGVVLMARLDERVSNLEKIMARHEVSLEKDMTRHEAAFDGLSRRTDDQERRLVKLEAALELLREATSEIRADVKTLLKTQK